MSKGSQRRKCLISRNEESLRYELALGKMASKKRAVIMQKLKRIHNERIS